MGNLTYVDVTSVSYKSHIKWKNICWTTYKYKWDDSYI